MYSAGGLVPMRLHPGCTGAHAPLVTDTILRSLRDAVRLRDTRSGRTPRSSETRSVLTILSPDANRKSGRSLGLILTVRVIPQSYH